MIDINQINRQYYTALTERNNSLLNDNFVRRQLHKRMIEEGARPIEKQRNVDYHVAELVLLRDDALIDERVKIEKETLHAQAKKGGKAKKADSLTLLVEDLVKAETTYAQLISRLDGCAGLGVIDEVTLDEVAYTDSGRSKSVTMRALRDRFYRAKRKLSGT